MAESLIQHPHLTRNPPPARLYEDAIRTDGGIIAANGALVVRSGQKTGRSPADKRIVEDSNTAGDVWWGPVNFRLSEESFERLRSQAIERMQSAPWLYAIDGFAGWSPQNRLKVRVFCTRAYHALFMHNMLIRPGVEAWAEFDRPDVVIFNAGQFPVHGTVRGISSTTAVVLHLARREMVIFGTEYAGEMKKGIFTLMNYLLPKQGILSMHCSANEGPQGDVTLFFGLSGTGKTTLSADPKRRLIGDDEHGWDDDGIFNIEGGCYAKCIGLSAEKEPEIYQAIRFGTVLENVIVDPRTREPDYADTSLTENTRASYPIEFIQHAKIPCRGGHPKNIIFLTCDARGILPPVSRLTPEQASYQFVNGYTAKVAGTEVGVQEPSATFSPCYGGAFLIWHPLVYARQLAERIERYRVDAWLINTGWTGGPYGEGRRIPLSITRAIIDAIHDGTLAKQPVRTEPLWGLEVPVRCPNVPDTVLDPRQTWRDPGAYDAAAERLAALFEANYREYTATGPPV
ncbi:MAG: phosphoenolpyruvate carboxykinase [ATP] 2 [Pirellulaceae bacterium]|nr:MAG: phosphoenolpyruvate carboxykinase [ATP] 2 [Pirellulaceae bacterium]